MPDNQDIKITIDSSEFEKDLKRLEKTFTAKKSGALFAAFETLGLKMQNYAKANKPWTNRTGRAQQSLNGGALVVDSDTIAAFVAHGVFYGVFLELSHQRRFAILEATARKHQSELEQIVGSLLKSFK